MKHEFDMTGAKKLGILKQRRIDKMQMTMTYEFISPEMAAYLLETNSENRKLSEGTVRAYVNDILADNWDETVGVAISIDADDTCESSLCERCVYPLVKCQWLLGGRPFEGSEYIEKKVHYYGEVVYSTYVITACPHYEEGK